MSDNPKCNRQKHKKGQSSASNKNVSTNKANPEVCIPTPSPNSKTSSQKTAILDSPNVTLTTNIESPDINKGVLTTTHELPLNSATSKVHVVSNKPKTSKNEPKKATEIIATTAAVDSSNSQDQKTKAELKAERKAIFEAQRAALLNDKSNIPTLENNRNSTDTSTSSKEKDNTPVSVNEEGSNENAKSKAQLRAERRAVQEAQRAAKSGANSIKVVKSALKPEKVMDEKIPKVVKEVTFAEHPEKHDTGKSSTRKEVKLVSHLPPFKQQVSVVEAVKKGVHPELIKLGLRFAAGTICGSNSRCVNFIETLKQVIKDFKMPENKDFNVAVYSMCIEPAVKFLNECRPISVGMRNVCKMLREEISNIPKDDSEDELKKKLEDALEIFLENHIHKAHDSIVNLAMDKITCEDVIVTYGCSYIVKLVLKKARENCKFRVIVVDGRPKLEGRNMCRYLIENGIDCTYVLINALAHVMPEATKVILGAHGLLANGCVMSRVGSSQVALVAKAFNKPVLVCCETYKFSDIVQTDSFVLNELGNPEALVETHRDTNPLSQWKETETLNILNLNYDVTPPDLVTVLINEGYVVPCTSVPVVLRVRPKKK